MPLAEVGAQGMWQCPSATQQISGQAQAGDKRQQLGFACTCSPLRPFHPSGAAPGHPCASVGAQGRLAPAGWAAGGRGPAAVAPPPMASLCRQSRRGREPCFPPGTPARWERLGSHTAVRVSQPTQEHHCLPGLHSSSKSAPPDRSLPSSLLQWAMAAGKSRKRAIIYDAAPNIAADHVFCSGDFLSFLWFVSVGTPP